MESSLNILRLTEPIARSWRVGPGRWRPRICSAYSRNSPNCALGWLPSQNQSRSRPAALRVGPANGPPVPGSICRELKASAATAVGPTNTEVSLGCPIGSWSRGAAVADGCRAIATPGLAVAPGPSTRSLPVGVPGPCAPEQPRRYRGCPPQPPPKGGVLVLRAAP